MAIVTINKKSYEIKYTFGSFDAMHQRHGINVFDLPAPTPRLIAVLIWGAIIHVDPKITPEEISGMISMQEAMDANSACIKAIMDCLPKRADVEQKST